MTFREQNIAYENICNARENERLEERDREEREEENE